MILSAFAGPLARKVAALLRDDPAGWSFTYSGYRLIHKSGLSLWVSNGVASLDLRRETKDGGEAAIWGLSPWFLLGGSPDQQAVWSAYKAWRLDRLTACIDGEPSR